jgi:hypothetical protein
VDKHIAACLTHSRNAVEKVVEEVLAARYRVIIETSG